MTLTTFRDKLFMLQEQKALTNNEIKFLNLFNTVEQIYNIIKSAANDSKEFTINNINIEIISDYKSETESIWLKILNAAIN